MDKEMNLNDFSAEELRAALQVKEEEQKRAEAMQRDAYVALREKLLEETEMRLNSAAMNVQEFYGFCVDNVYGFRQIMAEYGQLRRECQMSFQLQNDTFRILVKSNKVKKFDERADMAAQRLIEFLQAWIKNKEDSSENPMYVLAMTLLERNKNGDLDYKSISKLYELESKFDDPEYSAVMQLFKESHITEGTSTNFYFERKNALGVWNRIEISFNRL